MAATGCSQKCFLAENAVKYGSGWLTVVIKVVELINMHVLSPQSSPDRTNGSWDVSKLAIYFLNKRSSYLQPNMKKFTERSILQIFFLKLRRYGNFDVPVQKKNTKKIQDGCHWEQNGFKNFGSILLPVAAILEFCHIFFLNGDFKINKYEKVSDFFHLK